MPLEDIAIIQKTNINTIQIENDGTVASITTESVPDVSNTSHRRLSIMDQRKPKWNQLSLSLIVVFIF